MAVIFKQWFDTMVWYPDGGIIYHILYGICYNVCNTNNATSLSWYENMNGAG